MDKSRIKNFILILLALVNVFLLSIVVSNSREEKQAQLSRTQALKSVFADNGITLASDIALPNTAPASLELKRDMKAEKKDVSGLIGSCSVSDEGGNIIVYSGSKGVARFRGTGAFDILLNPGVITKGKDPAEAAKRAMKKLGMECSDTEPEIKTEDGDPTVTLYGSYDGTTIYNAKVEFSFQGDNLQIISGTRAFDTKSMVKSSDKYSDSVTILMSFLESRNQTGYLCNEITDVTVEYNMYSTVSGSCILKPVWCITTNSGLKYIDAETGKTVEQ